MSVERVKVITLSRSPRQRSDCQKRVTELRNKRLIVKLKREYRQTVDELERLTGKYPYDHIESQVNELFQRQRQIIKEIETCTGIEVPIKTRQDILEENKKIQSEGDKK